MGVVYKRALTAFSESKEIFFIILRDKKALTASLSCDPMFVLYLSSDLGFLYLT